MRFLTKFSIVVTLALAGCEASTSSVSFPKEAKPAPTGKQVELLNVSYDPTREFYQAYNAAFAAPFKNDSITK